MKESCGKLIQCDAESTQYERAVKVDYFSFTTRRSVPEVLSLFLSLKNPLVPQDRGLHGYHFSFVSSDGVTVLYTPGRPDVHVQLSGRGCDQFELTRLLDCMLVDGDHVSRLDIAVDCFNSGVTCGEIWGFLQSGEFISASSDIRQSQGLLSRGSQFQRINRDRRAPKEKTRTNSGHTIYVGAPSSDRMVRIYDKGAEQETGNDWLRFEVQLRRESANQFFSLIRQGGFVEKSLALLNKQIRFIESGQESLIEDRHYDRVVLNPFWKRLVDSVAPLKMMLPKPIKTVRNALRYVRNAGAAIKMLKGVMPDFDEFFEDLVENAKLKVHHIALQDDYHGASVDESGNYHYTELSFMGC